MLNRLPRFHRSGWLLLYAALLAASNVVAWLRGPGETPAITERLTLDLPAMDDSGRVEGRRYRLAVLRWRAPADEKADGIRPPIVLLHGCPSRGGRDFERLAPLLAREGYTVYAPDLPGSGASERPAASYSILATAKLVLAAMEELGLNRAHLVGWSQGGGAAMWMADLAPRKVASLTLLASIGTQETEGSGDYYFEHFKYRVGHVLATVVPEFVPHFGMLGSRAARWSLLRPFMDSDLRPMRSLMQRLRTPTLILHGRHDFMVPAWAAEEHHRLIGPSTLVMLDAGHFIPAGPPLGGEEELEEGARHVLAFVREHDRAGGASRRGAAVFSPPEAHIAHKLGGFEVRPGTPWWLIVLIITVATFISEDLTTITVGLLIAAQSIDWGVALLGCFFAIFAGDAALWLLGRTLGRRVLRLPLIGRVVTEQSLERWGQVLDRHTGKAVLFSRFLPGTRLPTFVAAGVLSKKAHLFLFWVAVAAFLWTPFLLGLTILVGPSVLGFFKKVFHGPWAIVAAILAFYVVIRLVGYETTAMGRDRLKADLRRIVSREFWPLWMFYLPLVPYFLWLSLRHRGLMTFTCANPGIPAGGGMIGESKGEILRGFVGTDSARWIAPFEPILAGPEARARAEAACRAIREREDLGGFPVILKPDQGFRGFGVKLARSERDVHEYFRVMTRDVLVQRYHPGPYELSVVWARVPRRLGRVDNWLGEVFSATAKEFPVIEGDGRRRLELLIWHHPRFRMQADVFLKRHAERLDLVLAPGERLLLGLAGNHCQGTKFIDGLPAVTHGLAARLEGIAQSFRGAAGRRIDFVRFDLRYRSEAELARGEGFLIVEVNGTSAESTSMYDPTKSVWWTYGLLYRHWERLFRLGAARRREGVRPMRIRELIRAWRAYHHHRPGLAVSD